MNQAANYAAAVSVGPRFLVAGFMLAIMASWMSVNHEDSPFAPVAVVAGVAAVSLVWGISRMRLADDAAMGRILRNSGMLALVGALVLAGVGIWWLTTYKLAAFGEVVGLELFAIVCLAAAWQYLGGDSHAERWDRIRGPSLGVVSVAFLVLGAVFIGAFLYLGLTKQAAGDNPFADPSNARSLGADIVPEMVGMLLAGFTLFFGGLYLFTNRQAASETETLRLFFLVVGATLGGLTMAVSIVRSYLWSNELFRAGFAEMLTGPDAWHFWVVAYAFLIGLSLVLGAMAVAFFSAEPGAPLRRYAYGVSSFVSAILMFIVLTTLVVLVYLQWPYNPNWSKTRGVSGLAMSTKNLLAELDRPVHVYALINSGNPIYDDLIHFLANCKVFSTKFDYEIVSPEKNPEKYKPLETRFREIGGTRAIPLGRGVLVVYGQLPKDVKDAVPHAFIPAQQLYEQKGDPGKPPSLFLKAENEVMRELSFLTNKSERHKVYFLQGDEELDVSNTEGRRSRSDAGVSLGKFGAAKFVEKLKKDRFDVAVVSFGMASKDKEDKKSDIVFLGGDSPGAKIDLPDDCKILIIAGPSAPLPQNGLDALERFMDRNGHLILYFDVFTDRGFTAWKESGLEAFAKKYGVDVTQEIVLRVPQQRDFPIFRNATGEPSAVIAEAPANPKSLLAKQFEDQAMMLWTARVIKPGNSAKYQVEPLLVVDGAKFAIWADDNPRGLGDLDRYVIDLSQAHKLSNMVTKKSLPIAVTVTEGSKPRMVVFGDAEFISNEDLSTPNPTNYDLARSAIEWLSERGFVGPSPKETSTFTLAPTADQTSMLLGTFWTLIIAIMVLGGGVWLGRRR